MDLTPYWESDGERRREQQLQLGGPPVGERCICTYVAAPAAVHVPMVVFSFVPRQSRHGGCVWRRHGRGQHRARESRGGEGAAQRKALPPWQPEGPRSPPLRMGGGDPKVFRLTVFESRGVSSTELAESFPTVCLAPPNSQRRSVPSVQWGLLPTPTLARANSMGADDISMGGEPTVKPYRRQVNLREALGIRSRVRALAFSRLQRAFPQHDYIPP